MFDLKRERLKKQKRDVQSLPEPGNAPRTEQRFDCSDSTSSSWQLDSGSHAQRRVGSFQIQVANQSNIREQAWRLLQNTYARHGLFADEHTSRLEPFLQQYPDTFTLLATDPDGLPAATISLVFDSEAGLPCDAVFPNALSDCRKNNPRQAVAEVVQFAIADAYRNQRMLLTTLFNFLYLYSTHVRNTSYFAIEVNPSHVAFYNRLLCFNEIDEVRPCNRVGGAPAVLLGLDLEVPRKEITRALFPKNPSNGKSGKTLYKYFLHSEMAAKAVQFLTPHCAITNRPEILLNKRCDVGA